MSHASALRRELREQYGIRVRVSGPPVSVKHTYTHFRMTLHAFRCECVCDDEGAGKRNDIKWIRSGRLTEYPFDRCSRKVIEAFSETFPTGRRTRK